MWRNTWCRPRNVNKDLKIKAFWPIIPLLFGFAALTGCGRNEPSAPAATGQPAAEAPPHGGVPVALGEDYKLELVLDAQSGRLDAYVLDGEFENFVRISDESFEVSARLTGGAEVLSFKAVPNRATGETVGDTSMFEAQAGWLKSQNSFPAVLKELKVKGNTYTNIAFNFSAGKDASAKN